MRALEAPRVINSVPKCQRVMDSVPKSQLEQVMDLIPESPEERVIDLVPKSPKEFSLTSEARVKRRIHSIQVLGRQRLKTDLTPEKVTHLA